MRILYQYFFLFMWTHVFKHSERILHLLDCLSPLILYIKDFCPSFIQSDQIQCSASKILPE